MTDTDKIVPDGQDRWFWPVVGVLAICACVMALVTTGGQGIGVSPDSVYYLEGAQNILAGRGYSTRQAGGAYVPITHWPPGYSLALAAFSLGGDLLDAARRLNALLMGLLVIGAAGLVRQYSGRSWAGVVAGLLVAGGAAIMEVHTVAWSEPLFMVMALGACALFGRYTRTGRWRTLLATALLAGMTVTVRYAGAALVVALIACLVVILLRSNRIYLFMKFRVGIFTLVSALPVTFWLISLGMRGARGVRQGASWEAAPLTHLADAGHSMSLWFLPQQVPAWLRATVLLLAVMIVLALTIYIVRRLLTRAQAGPARMSDAAQRLVLVYGLAYGGLLAVSIGYFDPDIVLDSRTLSPFYLCVALGLPLVCAQWAETGRVRASRVLIAATTIFWIGGAIQTLAIVQRVHLNGAGLNTIAWRDSGIVAGLRQLPERTLVYTNQVAALRFWTRCDAAPLPPVLTAARPGDKPPELHPLYFERMKKALETLQSRGGALAVFRHAEWYYQLPQDKRLELLREQLGPARHDQLRQLIDAGENQNVAETEGELLLYSPAPLR